MHGEDPRWAVFYADWLVESSSLDSLLETALKRDALRDALIEMDDRYVTENPDEDWAHYYAARLIERFGAVDV